jgi:rod shape-determining protein MreD
MKRILLNFALIILAFTIQSCLFPLIPFLSATPNLVLILVFSFGFTGGEGMGMACGVFAGLCLDLFYGGALGFYILFFVLVGYTSAIFNKYYYEDLITLPLVLSFFSSLAYHMYIYIFRFLIRRRFDFWYYLRELMIPEIIFTMVATLFFYRFFLYINRRMSAGDRRWQ